MRTHRARFSWFTTVPSSPSTPPCSRSSVSCRRSGPRCSSRSTATRTYSASARYARALAQEILPELGASQPTIGVGASLGALALLHAHRRHPESFDALFLQSGSFFRRRDRHEAGFPRFDRISRFIGSTLAQASERTIPVTIVCGTVEDNFPSNLAMCAALRRQGYDACFHEFRDGHNWVAWRDSFHPHLSRLLQRAT